MVLKEMNRSERMQKAFGTRERNWVIRRLHKEGRGLSNLGRVFHMSRQRIFQICKGE